MLPVTSCFSIPPMRCSSPGVPGRTHGRASVAGSRRYGKNPALSVRKPISIGGSVSDRKSTRLNSSHSQISYAVFCLKKKNRRNAHMRHYLEDAVLHNRLQSRLFLRPAELVGLACVCLGDHPL